MNTAIKDKLYGPNHLQNTLGISRTQAWRIWNGKSKLTKRNEELLIIKLDLSNEARKNCELAADEWIDSEKKRLGSAFLTSVKQTGANEITCEISRIDCEETNGYLNELVSLADNCQKTATHDLLTNAYFSEIKSWVVSKKEFLIEEYK